MSIRKIFNSAVWEINKINFFTQFITHPVKTGAIMPSSGKLAKMITDNAGLQRASTVVEFGSGTGVFTEKIYKKISKDTTFIVIEINPAFVEATKKRCPDVVVYQDSAANARRRLELHGIEGCDTIICSLPWAGLNEEMQSELLDVMYDVLNKGGIFITFSYIYGLLSPRGRRFRHMLSERFNGVKRTKIVWRNVPPAFVYCAQK